VYHREPLYPGLGVLRMAQDTVYALLLGLPGTALREELTLEERVQNDTLARGW